MICTLAFKQVLFEKVYNVDEILDNLLSFCVYTLAMVLFLKLKLITFNMYL